MTVSRALLVFCFMVVLGMAVVATRGESAKVAHRVQRLHQKKIDLEQTIWTQEMELARLRAPAEIRKRAGDLNLDVVPPPVDPGIKSEAGRAAD